MPSGTAIDTPTERPRYAPQLDPKVLWNCYFDTYDSNAENALVQEYLPLVRTVAGRLAMTLPAHVSAKDLFSAGLVGLLQAIRSFSPRGGASFETFARFRIRGAVLDELRRLDWVPRSVHEKARKIHQAVAELEQRLGYAPSELELVQALGLTLDQYRLWSTEVQPVSFLRPDLAPRDGSRDGTTPHERIADESQEDPCETVSRSELKQLVAQRIGQLPEPQRKVLVLYYFKGVRLRDIAEAFGVTEARISQIHSQAIQAIRSFIERKEALALRRAGALSLGLR
jgi:RNA polymerase sigma factor for flagellar operon FliA